MDGCSSYIGRRFQSCRKSLGYKTGLKRMWCAKAQQGDAVVELIMDLSNRPCLTSNFSLT